MGLGSKRLTNSVTWSKVAQLLSTYTIVEVLAVYTNHGAFFIPLYSNLN